MAKKLTIDLRQSSLLGPSCKFLEMLVDLKKRGYSVNLIAKEWDKGKSKSGLTFNKEKGKFTSGESRFLVDPKLHPVDFYENLVVPTFEHINYLKIKKSSFFKKQFAYLKGTLSPNYISEIHYTPAFSNKLEKKRYFQQHVDLYMDKPNLKNTLVFFYSAFNLYLSRRFKICPQSLGFRYKLNEKLLNNKVKDFINKAKENNTKYILISSTWDDEMIFEPQEDRKRGILYNEIAFNSMINYVKDLDKYALQGKVKFVLASKKAVDWPTVIKSEFIDLREFEKLGFTLSQMIYISQEISSMTINWPSTFSIWITNCSNILHLTWGDKKDTSKWSRNNLHTKKVEKALKLIKAI